MVLGRLENPIVDSNPMEFAVATWTASSTQCSSSTITRREQCEQRLMSRPTVTDGLEGSRLPASAPDPNGIRSALPIIEQIGPPSRGGQRVVYPVTISGRPFALMVMPLPESSVDEEADEASFGEVEEIVSRARREFAILENCDIPQLVKTGPIPPTQCDIRGARVVCFAEEWIDGMNIDQILTQTGPLPVPELIRLGTDIATAVKALWSLAIVHRDIKPRNVMKRIGGTYVLLDMGFALDLSDKSLSASGVIPGTLAYFSPEQVDLSRKRLMDFRSDLFSLGIVLYQAATNHHPFWAPGMTTSDVLARASQGPSERPSTHRRDLPLSLERIILRLLMPSPHMRFKSCDHLIGALRACTGGSTR